MGTCADDEPVELPSPLPTLQGFGAMLYQDVLVFPGLLTSDWFKLYLICSSFFSIINAAALRSFHRPIPCCTRKLNWKCWKYSWTFSSFVFDVNTYFFVNSFYALNYMKDNKKKFHMISCLYVVEGAIFLPYDGFFSYVSILWKIHEQTRQTWVHKLFAWS